MVGTVTFNQAMLAKDRVFAIRAGAYTSSDIKEASFNYGYISGDTFKPGGTVAGSAKLIFTSIITTFNKLDKIYPEIGLLVGDSYEWVAMGEYFVNDISIDRNRNTTELDLMDGMFKLNQPYISDLTYPAQIRDVIREICVKTGIELETDNLGLKAIQRHIEVKADKKDITFREVLSQAIQLLGFSAFFNRKGKLEVRGLTESRITVTADNYFLHGLTKSEIQYQIAGITCKKDKETLTVGLRTGRSLELENSFMNQNLLDELYYELKDIKYYPFSLDWQGHLKLDVGQWVTLKTNKNETYKVPVLSQSFSFKGGLKSKISADSKAGNDTQYSYKGFLTKQIEQMSTQIDAEIQQQLEYANAEFDRKTEEYKKELDDGIEKSKAEAEAYADTIKQEIDTEIAQVNQSMQAQSEEHDRQVAAILSKTQAVESLANQAKTDAASAITTALQSKDEAIADARAQIATVSQALNTAESELQTAIASADQKARDSQASATALRNDLNLQASKILEQARAQTALTNRVTTVETLADGTRSTVAELSKTVNKATGDIASVVSRTKTVEDTLSQTRAQYEVLTQTVNAQTGQIESINRKTADLQSGIDGVTERFESLQVGGENLLTGTRYFDGAWQASGAWQDAGDFSGLAAKKRNQAWHGITQAFDVVAGETYTFSVYVKSDLAEDKAYFYLTHNNFLPKATATIQSREVGISNEWKRVALTFTVTESGKIAPRIERNNANAYLYVAGYKLERGSIATDYSSAEEDLRSEIATYVRNAAENSAELSRQIQLADGKAVEAKTYAQQTAEGFRTRLESLEIYKNEEGARASQYFTASRDETARQITAERTAIANNYVAKSTYDENVRGTTLKLNEIKSTADTAKQNLATYQETVDRKLTELTSSTQTLDGKINTASAKVDTVAGQIRTELTRVEGKIPSDLGGRNYILKSDVYATSGSRHFDTSPEFIDYAYSGKYVTISLDIKGENLVPDSRGLSRIGCELRLNLSDGKVLYLQCQKIVSGTQPRERISVTRKIPEGVSVVSANKVNMYVQVGGTALAGRPKFELSSIPSDWSPAPEDINSELSSTKTLITQTAEGQTQLSNRLTTTQDKVSTAEAKINQLIGDVSSKVSQTDYNTLTGRVDIAETAITQNATEISKRLTSTQVESAITSKGYQTKSDVDSNITGRGYITSSALSDYAKTTTVQTLVRETADSFSRTISETKALIPTEMSGNLILDGNRSWSSTSYLAKEYQLAEPLEEGKTYTLVIHWWRGSGASANYVPMVYYNGGNLQLSAPPNTTQLQESPSSLKYDAKIDSWVVTFTVKSRNSMSAEQLSDFDKPNPTIRVYRFGSNVKNQNGGWADITHSNASFATLVKGNIPLSRWEPAFSELATVTALHNVTDTVDSHTRTIGAVGTNGSILDNISKVTQTAAGLVQEVSGTNGLKTQVSTLAGSWAVKNLNSDGDILSQANLSPDSFLLEAAKIRLKGKTLADEIQAIDGKFNTLFVSDGTFGKLDAKIIGAQAITGDQIKFDKGFFDALAANRLLVKDFFAKDAVVTSIQAVTLSATQIKSGVLKAFNDRTTLDLSTGKLTFNDGSPSIEFNSDASAIRRVTNGQSQFIKFASYLLGTQTTIGANRKANDESIGTADFTGIQIQSRAGGVLSLIDKVYVCADEFVVDGGGGQVDGFVFKNREALYPQSSGMLNLGRLGNRWNNVYAFDYYVGQNAVDLRAFLDAVRACFHQIAYGGMTQTTYDLIKNNLTNTFNKIQ
ncbi:hypothetical protein HO594_08855 [Streptococcus suis]|nr:hypothetical protein [Streptococcus suis]